MNGDARNPSTSRIPLGNRLHVIFFFKVVMFVSFLITKKYPPNVEKQGYKETNACALTCPAKSHTQNPRAGERP